MTQWIKIAFRNILRNKRRSFVTLLAIAIGFSAVSLFRGYTDNTYDGLRNSAIRGEGLGHLTIFKKGWIENGRLDPENYLLTSREIQTIIQIVEQEDEVILGTPELHISGLVTNGSISTIFLAKGVIPNHDKTLKGAWAAFRPVTGNPLKDDIVFGVEMAQDLSKHLDFKPESEGVIMASTLDGQMNALNIKISGIYDTGNSATNDKYMRLPFSYAQELYDTDKADRVIVLLDYWKHTRQLRDRLFQKLDQAGLSVEIKTWNELSLFYTKVKGLFDMIFTFIFSIVLIIVVMSIINTIVWGIIRGISPTYTPPGSSSPVPLIVNLVPEAMVLLMVFLIILSLTAAILPARRAAKQNVVESLGHV